MIRIVKCAQDCGGTVELLTRDTLEECQALAEATARLWAGESE